MKNKWGKSLTQLVVLVIYFIIAIAFKGLVNELKTDDSWANHTYLLVIFDFCFYASFGIILGIINFVVGKRRKRKANVSKVILLLIPSLFFGLSMLFYFSTDIFANNSILESIVMKATLQWNIVFIYQILFGYLLVYSFEN